MALIPLTGRDEIRSAFYQFRDRMTAGKQKFPRTLGHQWASFQADVYWHEIGFWSCFDEELDGERHFCLFGTENPLDQQALIITCEINFPDEGINRRVAGTFVRDDRGKLYIAHSGKIGGGRKGIGKEAFWKHYGGDRIAVLEWPDGQRTNAMVIGELDSPTIPELVFRFISAVQNFKGSVQQSNGPKVVDRAFSPVPSRPIQMPPMKPQEPLKFHDDFDTLRQQIDNVVSQATSQALDFNLFKELGVERKESVISRFLSGLLDPSGTHGQGTLFLESFISLPPIGLAIPEISSGTWVVETEKAIPGGRLDIVISNSFTKHIIVIENKVDAGDQPDQLARYRKWLDSQANFNDANRRKLIYLTPDGREVQCQPGGGVSYERISYENDISGWLRECTGKVKAPHVAETLNQFIRIIESFSKKYDAVQQYKKDLAAFLSEPANLQIAMRINECFPNIREKLLLDFWTKLWEILQERLTAEGFAVDWVLSDPPADEGCLREGTGISINQQRAQTPKNLQLGFTVDNFTVDDLDRENEVNYGLTWNGQLESNAAPITEPSSFIERLVRNEGFSEGDDQYPIYKEPYEKDLFGAEALLSMSRGEKAVHIANEFWHFFVAHREEVAEINRKITS